MAMLRESLTKNMVKKEMKEPPRDLTNCKKRLEMEDLILVLLLTLFQQKKSQLNNN